MRIVIATPFYPPQSGVLGMYAEGLERAFGARGDTVEVIVFNRRLPPGARHVMYFFRLLRAARSADFVLALDTWSVGLPAVWAARMGGVPCAIRVGGDFMWESYVARTHAQCTLSEFYEKPPRLSVKEWFIRMGTRSLVRHATLIFTTRFQRALWARAYGARPDAPMVENYFPPQIGTYLPARGPVFVCAGRAIALKNVALVQRVFTRLQNDHLGLELDTRLLPPEEHGKRLAQAHAVVIASLSEVCSNTAIDAVCLGKPFICPKDTGTSEHLKDCGIFIDTRSEGALTQAVESLLDPATYERYATAARAFSFTHSFADIADEIARAMKG